MSGSVNKVILVELYASGKSLPDVASATGVSPSTVRYHVKKAGILRSRKEGLASVRHKLGVHAKGKSRVFTEDHKAAISKAKLSHGERHAAGVSAKSSGYIEITRGENKGRGLHVVTMEARIGRRIRRDEIVHHIDGDRANNSIDNLALMTRAAHARLHRREERLVRKGS